MTKKATLLLCALYGASAAAQAADPKFEFVKKKDEVKEVESKLQTKAGFILSTGNSRTTSLAAGVLASRKANDNRFMGEANVAYARSSLVLALDLDGSGFIEEEELQRLTQVSTQAWGVKGRYDRFFAESNSIFVSLSAASDVPAGKQLLGGGQLGYARRLYKTESSESFLEAGYDFQYEDYVASEEAVAIHSARLAALHSTKIGEANLFTLEVETLFNLNEERVPNPQGLEVVPPLTDFRTNVSANLTTALTDRIGFGFTFRLRYDNVPAPRASPIPFAPGFVPFSDKLDTTTEASLIVTLL